MSQVMETEPILIVDDNPNNLKVLSYALGSARFKVAVAKSGEGALKQVQYKPPALILLDVMMPGMDGFETCKRLKENPATKEIPVIFMTALDDTDNKVKGLSLGAVDYITKPFKTEEVLARVNVHMKLRSLSKQLQEQNQILEQKVTERTAELALSLEKLKETQIQLVQHEKMATLGQLVAGVGHEINNPVNFIYGNINHAQQYIQEVITLLNLYKKKFPEPGAEILKQIEAIDLDFVVEDLPQLISSLKEGTQRIAQISKSMRTFSRSDTSQMVKFNIHDGLDSTILILKHRLKANEKRPAIEIIKNYGNLPEVWCYPGQLNQVFMNAIANAIDALDESNQGRSYEEINADPNKIAIRTEIIDNGDYMAIAIEDNGPGMSQEVKAKIFDHLFTTKPPGKGTGLGLSISRQIVEEKHRGKLRCISSEGLGTEFIIEIPIYKSSD
ncbi:MAG: response regulator [Oscillatoria sp. SIO1A7]|nr:response regulator [Oscillatoria sp. SIO1A7]